MSYSTVKSLFKGICDAIRAKEKSTGNINHQDIPDRITNLPSGGDDPLTCELNGTEYNYTNTEVTKTFYKSIFYDWDYAKKISFTKLARIEGGQPFYQCARVTELHLPALTYIDGAYAISGLPELQVLELGPTLDIYYSSSYVFENIGVSQITIPPNDSSGNRWLPQYSLRNCQKLTYAKVGEGWKRLLNNCLKDNPVLTKVDLPSTINDIGASVMTNCPQLDTLIVRATTVPTISNSCLTSSKIAEGTGYIYVPDESVETYKTATNWSTYAAQIKGLSELPA